MTVSQVVFLCCLALVQGSPARSPRMVRHMVPIRERQDASLCPYDVVVDYNPTRIPDRVEKLLCRQEGCKCVEAGDFRCTQLYSQLNVSYATLEFIQFETLDVEQACVCARGIGRADLQPVAPNIV